MEETSYKPLPFKHISEATNETLDYIVKRRNNNIRLLKTRWEKFNRICGGGIEPNTVITIAGASSSGKSAFVNTLETDLIDLNSQEDIVVLSFSLEMLSSKQVGRKLSNKLRQTTYALYSSEEPIPETMLNNIYKESKVIKEYPIYYVDVPSSVSQIAATIKYFQHGMAKNKWLIIILDHTLLVQGGGERTTIVDLQNLFIGAKKIGRTSIIQISQMNRNIELPERINNIASHYPMRSDLSSSDSIFQGSDIVAVLSRPELLNITTYGPLKLPVTNKVYLHFLKQREGEIGIIEFDNDLKYNNLIESKN